MRWQPPDFMTPTTTQPTPAPKPDAQPVPAAKFTLLYQRPGAELRTHGIAAHAVLFAGDKIIATGTTALQLARGAK